MLNSGQNWQDFVPCNLKIWWMTLENNRPPLLYYIKLCASCQSHGWIQTGVTARKRSNQVKIGNFLSRVTNRAPLLCCFKLCASFESHQWIQTGLTVRKRPIWVLFSRVTLKFGRWPWKTIGHLSYATSSFVHHFVATGEFKLELQFGNAQFGSKSIIFLSVWPWNLTDDLEKQKGTSSKQHQDLRIISSSYVNSIWSHSPETAKLGVDLCDLDLWPLTLTFCMDVTSVIGNKSWKFHDDTMVRT